MDLNYATTSIQPAVLLYNPTYLKNHNIPIPTTWQNLTNPIYKGLMTMQNPATLSNVGLEMYWLSYNFGYTNSTWNSLMKGIAANNPIITTDPVISTAQVYTGQAAIGVGIIYNDYTAIINNASSGANPNNLAIDELGQFATAPIAPGLVGVAAGAPHPAMGELMEDWLLSPPGQYALGLTASRATLPTSCYPTQRDSYRVSLSSAQFRIQPSRQIPHHGVLCSTTSSGNFDTS